MKRWFVLLPAIAGACAVLLACFNIVTDPCGLFGDRFFNYWSYNMTNNPGAAKLAYLDRNHENYDSYIIGGSKTGAVSVDKLNEYKNAHFYNLAVNDSDLYVSARLAEYVIGRYEVKNLILNISSEDAAQYNISDTSYIDGGIMRYIKYIFAPPDKGIAKIKARMKRDYLPTENERFIPENGMYDYIIRDAEPVDDAQSDDGTQFYSYRDKRGLDRKDDAINAVRRVKELCDANGISFVLTVSPEYSGEAAAYDAAQLAQFRRELANVTDFYDFSGYNGINSDSRYFYDDGHFRTCVGDMMLACIYGDDGIYIPDNFCDLITADNAPELAEKRLTAPDTPTDTTAYTASVPILMYHHIDENDSGGMIVTPELFEENLAALSAHGYTAITFDDLDAYVRRGSPLPEKPVLITFDDGYRSNYIKAYPLLKQYGMKATIFMVGVTTGRSTYKDTGVEIIPHFSYAEAKEMYDSGYICIGSHTYDFHRVENLDKENYRNGATQLENETDSEFAELFLSDIIKSKSEIEANVGNTVRYLAYPQGVHSTLTDVCVKQAGYYATVTVQEAPNIIIKGIPQTLYNMNRIGVYPDTTGEKLIERIENITG